jgi:hypothetical protein
LIIAVASLGKFGGGAIAARLTGLNWRDSAALGVLMNTRGLMELIVLNIGYELNVISPTLFAMLVLMALVTTFITTPVLHLFASKDLLREEPADERPALRARPAQAAPHGIMVPVSNPDKIGVLMDLALAATTVDDSPPRVVALVRRPLGGVRSGLREVEHRVVPRSPALTTALEYALEREAAIVPQTSWTDHPARDIIRLALEARVTWILLGYHRPAFGADFRGGTVREILELAASQPLNVGIVVNNLARPIKSIAVIADNSAHGWASLDLATRIGNRLRCEMRLLWPATDRAADGRDEMLAIASSRVGRVSSKTADSRTLDGLDAGLSDELVVVGADLADELKLSSRLTAQARCTIVVQGGATALATASGVTPRTSAVAD